MNIFPLEILEVQVRFQHTVKQVYFQNEDDILKKKKMYLAFMHMSFSNLKDSQTTG